MNGFTTGIPSVAGTPWTAEDEAYLRAHYPTEGARRVGLALGRRSSAVRCMAFEFGVKKEPRVGIGCDMCGASIGTSSKHYSTRCRKCSTKARRHACTTLYQRLSGIWRNARARARAASIPFDLTLKDVVDLWAAQCGRCFYSGLPMAIKTAATGRGPSAASAFVPSLDQAEAGKGYTRDNTRLCCWAVNAGKQKFHFDTYLTVCAAVVRKQTNGV